MITHLVISIQGRGSRLILKLLPNAGILNVKWRWGLSNAQPRGVLVVVSILPCPGVIQQMIVWCVTTVYPIMCSQMPWSLVLCQKEEINTVNLILFSTGGNDAIQWNWSMRTMNIFPCYSNMTMYHLRLLSITLKRNHWVSLAVNAVNLIVDLISTHPYYPWMMDDKGCIKQLKQGLSRKMLKSASPKRLWYHCIELEALIRSNTALHLYDLEGQVPGTVITCQTTDIRNICKY